MRRSELYIVNHHPKIPIIYTRVRIQHFQLFVMTALFPAYSRRRFSSSGSGSWQWSDFPMM